jgi:MOSC domain-containing protein YiiM/GNAT superfamily N-acetyltransferase
MQQGRVVQINVSGGGVPKLPVDKAWVGRWGLRGDAHDEFTVHGGPHQAVCLFGIEAIERLQSEGHPVEPGSVGENLTTTGVEWSLLPIGTRARIGDSLEIEVASAATPCKTQTHNFIDGRFSRMSIDLFPSDSRMYARVLAEGEVKPGDTITVLPPAAESRAEDELLLYRLDRAETKSSIASWRAARESGFEIHIVEDGDIAMACAPALAGPAFNNASGLACYPNLVGMATDFYDKHGSPGWLWMDEPPWPEAQAEVLVAVFAADPSAVGEAETVDGLTVRLIGPEDSAAYVGVRSGSEIPGGLNDTNAPNPWPAVYHKLAKWPLRFLFLAELDGKPVGAASLHTHGPTGWLRGAVVDPLARGRGIQRALIAARVAHAIEKGCDLVGSWAEPDGPSAANLARMGFRAIGMRRNYEYRPAGA